MTNLPPNPFSPEPSPPAALHASDNSIRPPTSGMAVAALVCSIVGFCLFPAAVVGIVLGVLALKKTAPAPMGGGQGGRGLAVASIPVGGVALIAGCLSGMFLLGSMMPALASARQSARETVDSAHLRAIGVALNVYASENKGRFPESAATWQSRLPTLDPKIFKSPNGAGGDYIYVPPKTNLVEPDSVVAFTDPRIIPAKGRGSILFADGRVETLKRDELVARVANVKMPDGTPALPPGSVGAQP